MKVAPLLGSAVNSSNICPMLVSDTPCITVVHWNRPIPEQKEDKIKWFSLRKRLIIVDFFEDLWSVETYFGR